MCELCVYVATLRMLTCAVQSRSGLNSVQLCNWTAANDLMRRFSPNPGVFGEFKRPYVKAIFHYKTIFCVWITQL